MHFTPATILVAGLAAQRVAATGWSVGAKSYSCPANTDNQCSTQQQGGYDWSGLNSGSFSSYGSNKFSGFQCSDAPHKRDVLSKRAFQDKCISGGLDDKPSISCHDDDTMSIDTYHISASKDADLDCEYGMPDGSTCTEQHSCSSEGSIIQNTQCGGAKSVTFKPRNGDSGGCSMSIHSIGFNCGFASSSVPASTPTISSTYGIASSSIMTTSSVATTSDVISFSRSSSTLPSIETSPVTTSSAVVSTTSSVVISTSSTITSDVYSTSETSSVSSVETSPATASSVASITASYPASNISIPAVSSSTPALTSSYGCYGASCSSSTSDVVSAVTSSSASISIVSYSTSTVYSTTQSTSVSSGSTVIVTATIAISTTICPVTATQTGSVSSPASISSSTPLVISGSSTLTPNSTLVSAVTSSSASSYPTPNCPDLLPSCLNTWMYETGCKDNSDSDCYCKDSSFITHVMGCISAWSGSSSDTSAAASYLQGICAAHVPSNPAIITACPSTVVPATESSPATTSPAPIVPSTITIYSTQEYTITSCGPEVTNCPASSTVISTSSVPVSTSVVTPSSSPVSPVTSSIPAVPVAPSTITLYSTQEVTITSCAADVTNCPASSTVVATTSVAVSTTIVVPTVPASTSVAPVTAPAPTGPQTTITYSAPVTIPATYTTGVSSGLTINSSSITTHLITTVTVPQVQFTTSTIIVSGSSSAYTGLAAGCPSSVAATATAVTIPAVGAGSTSAPAPVYPTSFGTSYGTSWTARPTTSVVPFTGAGVKISGASFGGLAMGAVAALLVL
ncbi:hypothetical protein LTR86_002492 [Recurvomyces mirabilis]|nr:hypothetical protein LTR86_002492 [Recurvomyces mirabilis]